MYYDQTDNSEDIDINKIKASYDCKVCHDKYFFRINFSFQLNVCDGCHDLLQKAISFRKFEIFSVKRTS